MIVALGGDGFMLRDAASLPANAACRSMACIAARVGFLMNSYQPERLAGARWPAAQPVALHPLEMTRDRPRTARRTSPRHQRGVAVPPEAARRRSSRISVDERVRLDELIGRRRAASRPRSAAPPIIFRPRADHSARRRCAGADADQPFRPRRWRGALLPHQRKVRFDVLETEKRPVSAAADFTEMRDVVSVRCAKIAKSRMTMLFDPEHNLEERVLEEQFLS